MVENQFVISIVIIVALISFVLFSLGLRSFQTKKDPRLLSVSFAFFIFFFKNSIIALSLSINIIIHGDLELIGSLLDLGTILLLFLPIFIKQPYKRNLA